MSKRLVKAKDQSEWPKRMRCSNNCVFDTKYSIRNVRHKVIGAWREVLGKESRQQCSNKKS